QCGAVLERTAAGAGKRGIRPATGGADSAGHAICERIRPAGDAARLFRKEAAGARVRLSDVPDALQPGGRDAGGFAKDDFVQSGDGLRSGVYKLRLDGYAGCGIKKEA